MLTTGVLVALAALAGPNPSNLLELECKLKHAAYEWSMQKHLPQANLGRELARALSTPDCTITPNASVPSATQSTPTLRPPSAVTVYVSVEGSDWSGDGSKTHPFATLRRAQETIRAARATADVEPAVLPGLVCVLPGTYILQRTLLLGPDDGHTHWSGSCAGSPAGEVVITGAENISLSTWQPTGIAALPGVFVAQLRGTKLPSEASFSQLLANGKRQIRARWPNGDPEGVSGLCFSKGQCGADQSKCTQNRGQWPQAGEGCAGYSLADATGEVFTGPDQQYGSPLTVDGPVRAQGSKLNGDSTWWQQYITHLFAVPSHLRDVFPTGTVETFFGSPFARASSIAPQPGKLSHRASTWTNVNKSVVSMLHPELWGNWYFEVKELDTSNAEKPILRFSRGGWQDSQGAAAKNGTAFFIENILEELDSNAEYYYDGTSKRLYYKPNSTEIAADASEADISAALGKVAWSVPTLETLVSIQGHETGGYVSDIEFEGIVFTGTSRTVLSNYIYPSSGDWAIHPGGTLVIANAERVNITGCNFTRTGGNAVYLARHSRAVSITESSFRFIGDSAIASVGSTRMADGTLPTQPAGTRVERNWFSDIGIFGKQTSCYFQALSANATIKDNVCVNVPRAGITFNDQAFGGSLVSNNLVANTVRESTDHGPFNSWGRRPVVFDTGDGTGPRVEPLRTWIQQNILFTDYNGWFAVDSDDGSYKYNITKNVMVWGGCKNYLSADKGCGPDNVILYPGAKNRTGTEEFSGCQSDYTTGTDPSGLMWNQYYFGNKCFMADVGATPASFFAFCCQNCLAASLSNTSGFQSWNNTYYSPNAKFVPGPTGSGNCQVENFSAWQQFGQDKGSQVLTTPSADEIVGIAMSALRS